jgi:hypothetical protein
MEPARHAQAWMPPCREIYPSLCINKRHQFRLLAQRRSLHYVTCFCLFQPPACRLLLSRLVPKTLMMSNFRTPVTFIPFHRHHSSRINMLNLILDAWMYNLLLPVVQRKPSYHALLFSAWLSIMLLFIGYPLSFTPSNSVSRPNLSEVLVWPLVLFLMLHH